MIAGSGTCKAIQQPLLGLAAAPSPSPHHVGACMYVCARVHARAFVHTHTHTHTRTMITEDDVGGLEQKLVCSAAPPVGSEASYNNQAVTCKNMFCHHCV